MVTTEAVPLYDVTRTSVSDRAIDADAELTESINWIQEGRRESLSKLAAYTFVQDRPVQESVMLVVSQVQSTIILPGTRSTAYMASPPSITSSLLWLVHLIDFCDLLRGPQSILLQ